MQYWNDLYLEIANKVKDNITQIAWVDLWHEQVSYLTDELPFPTPSVFIAFNMLDTTDKGLKGQLCNTQIDLYLFYETFSDTYLGSVNQGSALDFLTQLTELHKLFHGTSGANYSEMRRVDMKREESGGAGNLYRISFQCIVDDMSAMPVVVPQEVDEIDIERTDIEHINVIDSSYLTE